jgi:hypothetical protein
MQLSDRRDIPYANSPALIAAHNGRQAAHYRYLASCAENLAAHHRKEGETAAVLLWSGRAERFRGLADRVAGSKQLEAEIA